MPVEMRFFFSLETSSILHISKQFISIPETEFISKMMPIFVSKCFHKSAPLRFWASISNLCFHTKTAKTNAAALWVSLPS